MQLLDVLQYAHGLGRVHADIKTTNLMYQAGQLTLIDWGVSYLITEPAVCWRCAQSTQCSVHCVDMRAEPYGAMPLYGMLQKES